MGRALRCSKADPLWMRGFIGRCHDRMAAFDAREKDRDTRAAARVPSLPHRLVHYGNAIALGNPQKLQS
ncbi:MAG: hypothetical protein LKF57_05165 [Bifidobacterium sp.]|nr:hypothetical protein [Bifidobacterium sp.]